MIISDPGAAAATVRRAGRAFHAGTGDDADVQPGDHFAVHQPGRQCDLPVRCEYGAIDDCSAAVYATAATRECDVLPNADEVIENGTGRNSSAGIYSNLRAEPASGEDQFTGDVEDELRVGGSGKEDLLAGQNDILDADDIHAVRAGDRCHRLAVECGEGLGTRQGRIGSVGCVG